MIQLTHRKAGILMKKRFAGFVVLAAAAAAVAMMFKKEEDDLVLITLDEDEEVEENQVQDTEFPHIQESEKQTWKTRIKILLKSLVDQQEITLVHYCKFNNQHDLFEAVKKAKEHQYTLSEADEKHQVVLEKTLENFFDDVFSAVLVMAEITRSNNGIYREFEIN